MTGYFVHGAPAGEINKIDNATTDGLSGTSNSLAYRVEEIEKHLHSNESWFGAAVTPDGEVHVADRIGTSTTAFQADAGNNTWGSWLQILGSDDTPARGNNAKFDLHRIEIPTSERTGIHFIQVAFGASGAAALASGDYTEFVIVEPVGQALPEPIDVQVPRYNAGTKAWLRVFIPGEDTGTLDFFFGLHEYIG